MPSDRFAAVDAQILDRLRRSAPVLMRWVLGLVFVWFGALKIGNLTPVADTLAFVPVPSSIVVPALGVLDVLAGIALIIGRFLRPVLVAIGGHLTGTFLVLVTQPAVAFQDGNPLLLTTEGEFVLKNLVLIAGALLVAAALPPLRRRAGRQ